jgi:EmrB/QacA subfamily drug resistance transporter
MSRAAQPRLGLVLAIVVTCQMMLILDTTVMNVALPAIQADLHFSRTGLSWVLNAYALAFGGLLLTGGRAGDILGRRRVFVGGVLLFTLASLCGGLATSSGQLLGARVAQGVGAAFAGPNGLALLATTFTEPRARIRALAIFSAVSSGGLALGLIVGGALTEWGTWRWVLFINVPFGVTVALLTPWASTAGAGFWRRRARPTPQGVVAPPPRHGRTLDVPGGATATAGFAGLVYALIRAADRGWGDPLTLGTFAASGILLAAFVAIEARTAQPLVPLRLFADRNRAGGYLIMFLVPAAMLAMFFFLTQFLQDVLGFGPLRTGCAFLPLAVALFGVTRLIPRLLPRFGPRRLVTGGMLLLSAGLIWLSQLSAHSGYAAAVLGPMVLFGLGAGLGASPLNAVIMAAVGPRDSGAASGALQTAQQVGSGLGLAILVAVAGAASRRAAGHPRPGLSAVEQARQVLTHGSAVAFGVATIFTAVAILVGLTLRRPAPPAATPAQD